ncbi:ABC transporter ATP-binding protein [Paenibacillus nuruki]|uniref:ABC transporter ATP-binding protein n=1 Tax=Paenibacillus nuruki TaxID=1886670 RepID=UPI0028047B42|nr:ABC transporter ATP-binding protein [Paenibacillus nuruki]CAJ1314937.1 ATP-binding/permease protein CydD [Paenibacillus nuruki]
MLQIENITKSYHNGIIGWKKKHQVLHGVSFACEAGESLGIIGESGSGKSTLVRMILGIERPDQGQVLLHGKSVEHRLTRRGQISAVFQDYTSSINPFFTVERTIMESVHLRTNIDSNSIYVLDSLLEQVGLNASFKKRYPHELSGGEAQRVCIARAIACRPQYLIFDEAISSLDVSIQVQVLQLLKELKNIYNMGYVFITHDIQAAAYICDRIIIFRQGQIEEILNTDQLSQVQSDYGRTLLATSIVL